ncbi:MAG: hypothetical protein HYT69_00990 [Candidatus Zambryskibacteria bacterium]|nr:hypothetical protein [Candidatus Zambryskibacteria bacterium]
MIISYQGVESFKISQGELTLAVNPQSKMSADITLFTAKRAVLAFAEASAGKAGFIIDGPGEYEVKDIFIKGFLDHTFLITFEGIKLCFLGLEADKDEIEDVDILFVHPSAYKSAVALEPAVMIPMDYDKNSLAQFLKEGGERVEPIEKFVVKKKDLEGKEGEIIVLKEE